MKEKKLKQKEKAKKSEQKLNASNTSGFGLHNHREIVFLLFATLLAIASAHISELFGYLPCKLCYYQRYVYYAIFGTTVLAFFFRRKLVFFLTLFFLLVAEFIVAFFHIGVEQKWWKYQSECVVDVIPDSAISDLSQIMSQEIVRCDAPQMVAWGLSMAGWNAVYAGFLIIIFTYLSYANKKPINR